MQQEAPKDSREQQEQLFVQFNALDQEDSCDAKVDGKPTNCPPLSTHFLLISAPHEDEYSIRERPAKSRLPRF
jgi:hypothetical protein